MYYLPSNCFICFKNDNSPPIELQSKVKNRKVEQITYVLPELEEFYSKINVCSECYATLQSFYLFKKKCLKNCTYIKNYVAKLQKSKSNEKQKDCDLQISINKNELITRLEQEKTAELNDDVQIKEEVVEQPLFVSCGTEMHNSEQDSEMVWKVKEEPFDEFEEQMNTDECSLKQEPEVNIVDTNEDISSSAEDNTNFHEDSNKDNSKATVLVVISNSSSQSAIPQKSRKVYEFAYERFYNWARDQNVQNHNYSESVMMDYFTHLADKMKSSSLWAQFSMVKAELNSKHSINIGKYSKLTEYLRHKNEGYKPKKSKVLNKKQLDDFLRNAPDYKYLATKVIMIFGVTGACRCDELLQLTVDDIEDLGELIMVKLQNSQKKITRTFTIVGNFYKNIYKKYAALRPTDMNTNRFFIKFQNGRCHRVVMGIHKIANVPREVATFLNLPNPGEFTGHCLRRTSALLVNGGDLSSLRRQSSQESLTGLKHTTIKILSPIDSNAGTSAQISNTSEFSDSNSNRQKLQIKLSLATEENIDSDDDHELLPQKSKTKYKKEYYKFCEWCKENNVADITEKVVLAYFRHMSETKRASTLWSSFSMLRICLSIFKDIDISKFSKVSVFLKRNSKNYRPKKSNVLNSEDIIKFINTADDDTFLAMKVLLIMGYCGACKRFELTNMKVNDVEIKPEIITVTVPKSKTNLSRMFVVTESSWIALIKHYVALRPPNITHNRFFLTYRRGRCLPSPIGINKIGVAPKDIARFLKLPNPKLYTGHCFRRSSAAHAKSQLGDMLTIKIHGGAAEGHIVSSIRKRLEIAQMFSNLSQDLSYASVSTQKPGRTVENYDSEEHNVQENTIGSNNDRRGVHNEIILTKVDQKLSITESSN